MHWSLTDNKGIYETDTDVILNLMKETTWDMNWHIRVMIEAQATEYDRADT